MNQSHVISGIAIATIALLLVTTMMSDQQSAFAHKNQRHHHNHGGSAAAAQQLAIALAAAVAAGNSAGSSCSSWWCRSSISSSREMILASKIWRRHEKDAQNYIFSKKDQISLYHLFADKYYKIFKIDTVFVCMTYP